MTSDTEPMQRVDLVPPPIPTLPTHRSQRQIDRAGAPPRFARGTTPPPFVVPASLQYTEVPPPARWGTVEEIVLLDRPREPQAAPAVEIAPTGSRRRPTLAIAGAVIVAVAGAIAIAAILSPGDGATTSAVGAPAATLAAAPPAEPAPAPEPAPIVVPIADVEDEEVDFEMEPEAVEISDLDARILDLLESGELPDEPAAAPAAARATPAKTRTAANAPGRVRKGTVMLGAKPPCRIVIDGHDTGLMTPQRDLRIPIGSHEITLINDEHGIRETIRLDVRPGKASRVVRDFSKRLRGAPAVF